MDMEADPTGQRLSRQAVPTSGRTIWFRERSSRKRLTKGIEEQIIAEQAAPLK
jgi:hypothetical protein